MYVSKQGIHSLPLPPVSDIFTVQIIQPYAATHPVMPAEGNHEACTDCPAGTYPHAAMRPLNLPTLTGMALSITSYQRYVPLMFDTQMYAALVYHFRAVPGTPINSGNFSEYQARLWSVALNAGANSGSNTNRYVATWRHR